ncbi:hypothetical protein [Brevundimonas sp.]|jgi:hypothetical protein|uniref:hypothetical protein n=1 Tax=Brevundimonas sp. TaxID=1871086 RepID=UPI0035B3EE60
MRLSPDELRARKRRNLFIALGLLAFIVLVFLTTVLRLQQNQADARAALAAPGVVTAEPAAR